LSGKNKHMALFLLSIGILICFCSCASGTAVREDQPHVFFTNSSKYILLHPKDIEKPMDGHQLVSASYGGQSYLINAWVKADKTGMDMTMVNEFGANMGELSYRDNIVSLSSPVFPRSLRPEYIVADFQLCFYNAGALRKALEDCGLSFEDTGTVRRILEEKTVIIEIEKKPETVRLVNHVRGYAYTLEGTFE